MSIAHAIEPIESELTLEAEEGRAFFDRESRRLLGIAGEEFLRRWDAGEYRDLPESDATRDVLRIVFLIPFARPES